MLRDVADRSKHELWRLGKLGRQWFDSCVRQTTSDGDYAERSRRRALMSADRQSSSARRYDGAVPCKHFDDDIPNRYGTPVHRKMWYQSVCDLCP